MVLLRSVQTSALTALSENYYYIIITNAMDFSEPYLLQKDFSFAYDTYFNILKQAYWTILWMFAIKTFVYIGSFTILSSTTLT